MHRKSRPGRSKMDHKQLDDQFEAFLKESISSEDSSLDTGRIAKFLDSHKKKDEPWWSAEDAMDDAGLLGTGKQFLKSKKLDNISELAGEQKQMEGTRTTEVHMSKDSLDDESCHVATRNHKPSQGTFVVPALNLGSSPSCTESTTADVLRRNGRLGAETLAEIQDKETFFKELEKSSDQTIDYAKLNRELDGTATMPGTLNSSESKALLQEYSPERHNENADADRDGSREMNAGPPDVDGSPDSGRLNAKARQVVNSNMLANVALLDSLDSTFGTRAGGSRDAKEEDEMSAIPENVTEWHVNHHDEDEEKEEEEEEEEEEDCSDDEEKSHNDLEKENGHLKKNAGPKFIAVDDVDEKKGVDSIHNRVATLKTATVINTDTSREIEALHQALRQVGMATLDTMKDFSLKDSSRIQESEQIDSTSKTAGFGLRQMAPAMADTSEKTIGDIAEEVEELKKISATKDDIAILGMDTTMFLQKINEEAGVRDNSVHFDAHANHYMTNGHDPVVNEIFNGGELLSQTDSTEHNADETKSKAKPIKDSRFGQVKSSGYGKVSPVKKTEPKKPITVNKSPVINKPKQKAIEKPKTRNNLQSNHDSKLLASFESLSKYIHAHLPENNMDKSKDANSQLAFEQVRSLLAEVSDWQNRWKEERTMQNKLKATLEAAEREHKRRLEELEQQQEEELSKLKQENYILSAKVSKREKYRKPAAGDKPVAERTDDAAGDKDDEEQVRKLQSELAEQEALLAGFQRENQRLYEEQRAASKQNRLTQDAMFEENQKLKTTISLLREEIERKNVELRNKGIITSEAAQQQIASGVPSAVMGAARITELQSLYETTKADVKRLEKEAMISRETMHDLREEIQHLTTKLADSKVQIGHLSDDQSQRTKEVEGKHKTEMDEMKRKLQWYAENQQLLDRDSQKLRDADREVKSLREQLERRQTEAANKRAETKARLSEKSADAKKIQDLERQVHEMQGILRRRHPDSLPVLMWAAAAAETDSAKNASQKAPSVSFLETRVRKLEEELRGKDEEAEHSLRALQQKFNTIKFKFEKRIEDLEKHLESANQKLHEREHPHTHTGALQRELESTRDRYKKRVNELETEVTDLKHQVETLRNKELASSKMVAKGVKDSESELQLRVRALQLECTNQAKEKQLLQNTIQSLRTEKQQLLIEATRRAGQNAGKAAKALGKKLKSKSKTNAVDYEEASADTDPLPVYTEPLTRDKDYEPDTFAGRHITDILRENEELKIKFDELQLQQHQQHVYAQKFRAESEASERRGREDFDDQLNAMKQAHQAEVERLLAEHAMQSSTSKMSQLQSRVDTQQVQIAHLKEQVACHELDAEKLAAIKVREATLEARVKSLLEELSEARACHTPEMRHFEALQMKLRDLSARQEHREHELTQLLAQHEHPARVAELQQQADRWRRLAESKNRETETFRAELDSILDVLRELQRQGVVLPCRPAT